MFDMELTVTVEAKCKVAESSSTDNNNLEFEILDNAIIYDQNNSYEITVNGFKSEKQTK